MRARTSHLLTQSAKPSTRSPFWLNGGCKQSTDATSACLLEMTSAKPAPAPKPRAPPRAPPAMLSKNGSVAKGPPWMRPVQQRLREGVALMEGAMAPGNVLRPGEDVPGVPGKRPGPKAAADVSDDWVYRWSHDATVPQEFYPERNTWYVRGRPMQCIICTHTEACAEEWEPYLAEKLKPLIPVTLYGVTGSSSEWPGRRAFSVIQWWKARLSCALRTSRRLTLGGSLSERPSTGLSSSDLPPRPHSVFATPVALVPPVPHTHPTCRRPHLSRTVQSRPPLTAELGLSPALLVRPCRPLHPAHTVPRHAQSLCATSTGRPLRPSPPLGPRGPFRE